jgi:chromosome segregation ATPase
MPSSDKKLYVETDKHGNPIFVRRRSSKSSHAGDSRSELKEKERENLILKAELTTLSQQYAALAEESNRQAGLAQHWQGQAQRQLHIIRNLQAKVQDLEEDAGNSRELRNKYVRVKNELEDERKDNKGLRARIRELLGFEQAADRLRREVDQWQRRFDQVDAERRQAEVANAELDRVNMRLRVDNTRMREDLAACWCRERRPFR